MNREEKVALVEEISAEISSSEAVFAVDYRGISVPQAAELRGKLREADASFKVVKNRLSKLAAEKAGVEGLAELLQGPTALTFVKGDTAQAAKAISTFNKEHEVLTYKGGFMGETILDEARFTAISTLPSRDVLNGQLAGVVASPIVTLTRGLGSMVSGLAIQLQQIAEQGLVGQNAPAAEPEAEAKAEEAPATEAEEAPEAEAKPDDAPQAEAKAEESEAAKADAKAEEAPEGEADAKAAEAPEAEAESEEAAESEAKSDDAPESEAKADDADAEKAEAADEGAEANKAPESEAKSGEEAESDESKADEADGE